MDMTWLVHLKLSAACHTSLLCVFRVPRRLSPTSTGLFCKPDLPTKLYYLASLASHNRNYSKHLSSTPALLRLLTTNFRGGKTTPGSSAFYMLWWCVFHYLSQQKLCWPQFSLFHPHTPDMTATTTHQGRGTCIPFRWNLMPVLTSICPWDKTLLVGILVSRNNRLLTRREEFLH